LTKEYAQMLKRMAGLLLCMLLVVQSGCAADVRERLAAGLGKESVNIAQLVRMAETELTPVKAAWLRGWQVLDVMCCCVSHPPRFYVALRDDGTTLRLTGKPDAFNQMIRDARIVVDKAALATEIGAFYLDVTRSFRKVSYRINDLSGIHWLPQPKPADEQRRAELEARYTGLIQPPTAEPSAAGWRVTAWMIYDRTLVRHRLAIAADGTVQDSPEVVETDMPLPYSGR